MLATDSQAELIEKIENGRCPNCDGEININFMDQYGFTSSFTATCRKCGDEFALVTQLSDVEQIEKEPKVVSSREYRLVVSLQEVEVDEHGDWNTVEVLEESSFTPYKDLGSMQQMYDGLWNTIVFGYPDSENMNQ